MKTCKLELCSNCQYNNATGMYHCLEYDYIEVDEDTECECED